jgi:pseudo-rSAM protein
MQKKYWFYIDTYVHVSLKKESLLLYNSLTGKTLEYPGKQKILNLVKKLQSKKNLQVTVLKENDLKYPEISRFVNDVRRYFMGDLIDASYSKGKPVQMMPIIKIQTDVKYLKKEDGRSVGEDLMRYLNEISLYINNDCEQNCGICSTGFRQFPCCTLGKNKKGELDIMEIERLVGALKGASLINLNILGGNIFKYTKFEEFLFIINPLHGQKTFHSHYLNLIENSSKLKLLDPNTSFLKILVTFPINKEKLKTALDIVRNTNLKSKFIFVIQSEKEFEKAEAVISILNIENHDFQPFYNGENLPFFKENIFTEKEEIFAAKPKMKDIYTNSTVNTLNFGRLTILNNGHIYANVNASRLGILGKDSIYDVLYKEMYHGKSWRRVRKNVEPCKHCTFEALCPPLSNYNHAIGRNNLCHMSF